MPIRVEIISALLLIVFALPQREKAVVQRAFRHFQLNVSIYFFQFVFAYGEGARNLACDLGVIH